MLTISLKKLKTESFLQQTIFDYNIYHSFSLISTFHVTYAAVIGHCFFPFFRWKPYLAVYIISWK